MISTRGFPCRHIWKVNCYLGKNDLSIIPIIARWTKDYGIHLKKAVGIADKLGEIQTSKNLEEQEISPKDKKNIKTSSILLNPELPDHQGGKKRVRLVHPAENSKKRKKNPVAFEESPIYSRTRLQTSINTRKFNFISDEYLD